MRINPFSFVTSSFIRLKFFLCFILFFAHDARAAKYKAIILHPSGFLHSSAASGASGSSQVGYSNSSEGVLPAHALLWNGSADSVVDLHPPDFASSFAVGVSGANQVGYGVYLNISIRHALLWSGTAESVVDLHPTTPGQLSYSSATAASGTNQVGYGSGTVTGNRTHALMWSGTAASRIDLHPPGYDSSQARGASESNQVGIATSGEYDHAILWNGTAASAVDLHPQHLGFDYSYGLGTSGASQVGFGFSSVLGERALLWKGTPASAVDLHPAILDQSIALGVWGERQVGYGSGAAINGLHALLWNGTADSVIDLHPFLSDIGSFVESSAQGISESGDIVGYASDGTRSYAVMWMPVPEPSTLSSLCLLTAVLACRARPRRDKYSPDILRGIG